MIPRNRAIAAAVIPCLLLAGCGEAVKPEELRVSGAKISVSIMHILAKRPVQKNRPSGLLGIYSGLYTSQGIFLPVKSAIESMQAVINILKAQNNSTSSENFALLREVGEVLQVDIIDALNRSPNRVETIDIYSQSLRNTGILIERKITELSALDEVQSAEVKEKRTEKRDIERTLRNALKDQAYAQASELEEQLAGITALHAELSVKADQTDDMIKRLKTLLDVTAERLQAVEANREILIAGLRVIDVPGISDFNILEEGKPWRKERGSSLFEREYDLN